MCPTLWNPMDCSLPGSSIHGIFQAKVLEWVAISFSKGSSQPRDRTQVSCIAGRHFTIWATWGVALAYWHNYELVIQRPPNRDQKQCVKQVTKNRVNKWTAGTAMVPNNNLQRSNSCRTYPKPKVNQSFWMCVQSLSYKGAQEVFLIIKNNFWRGNNMLHRCLHSQYKFLWLYNRIDSWNKSQTISHIYWEVILIFK